MRHRNIVLLGLLQPLAGCTASQADDASPVADDTATAADAAGRPTPPPVDYTPVTPSAAASAPDGTAPEPNAVTFDWPEVTATSRPQCVAGRYVGNFDCMYVPASGGGSVPVNGTVNLTLLESADGEFLEVQDGRLDGSANLIFAFGADIEGRLDCNTLRFEGNLINGAYSGLLLINGTFDGPLAADYDPSGPALVHGSWELHEQGATSNGTCTGNWTASWAP